MKETACFIALVLLSVSVSFGQSKTGTLKIFSELKGVVVYLDENLQGEDIKEITEVPTGTHYLKVMFGGASVFGDLVEIKDGEVTTILIKNTGQVQEKILETKIPEREEYGSKKVDVIFSTNSVSQTSGASSLYPGYYGYYGFSKSVTSTTQIADFKIIEGGIKEVSDVYLARLVDNKPIITAYENDYNSWQKAQNNGAITCLVGLVPAATIWVDAALKKPFLHENPTGESLNLQAVPVWELTTFVVSALVCYVGYKMMDAPQSNFIKAHYYKVEDASSDSQKYNKELREKLGLPPGYDLR